MTIWPAPPAFGSADDAVLTTSSSGSGDLADKDQSRGPARLRRLRDWRRPRLRGTRDGDCRWRRSTGPVRDIHVGSRFELWAGRALRKGRYLACEKECRYSTESGADNTQRDGVDHRTDTFFSHAAHANELPPGDRANDPDPQSSKATLAVWHSKAFLSPLL